MGCGCKNKKNSQAQTNTIKETTQTTVQKAIKQTVEKYYEKK
jgi:hypothetical protein